MKILGIETSCDETGVAVVACEPTTNHLSLESNIIATSLKLHIPTGGIIPENAAREQSKYMIPVLKEALAKANITMQEIDAIALTVGPGLIGSLLVGVETAKTLAYVFDKPILPVNHLLGHIYINWLSASDKEHREKPHPDIEFPALGLIVSGGHTDLLLFRNHNDFVWLGGTRDDAAGEAFDKIGRLLGLDYPAGAMIEKLAKEATTTNPYSFTSPMLHSKDYDFSFSGLKTAAFNVIRNIEKITPSDKANIASSVQNAIVTVLVTKTLSAAGKYGVKAILLGGGVAANQELVTKLKQAALHQKISAKVFVPEKSLCTDNGAMIAVAGYFLSKKTHWSKIDANPELYFS